MAFSRTEPRHHITYLRRRPKPGETPPVSAAPEPSSLTLGAKVKPSGPPAPEVPRLRGRLILSATEPTVSLDRRQSAIGSLVFELVGGGELACAWELESGESGVVSRTGRVLKAVEFARRPIVELLDARLVTGLRHVRRLRRLLIVVDGLVGRQSRLIGTLYGGATMEMVVHAEQGALVALALYQVDGEIVVRHEGAGFGGLTPATEAYGFTTTWIPPVERSQ